MHCDKSRRYGNCALRLVVLHQVNLLLLNFVACLSETLRIWALGISSKNDYRPSRAGDYPLFEQIAPVSLAGLNRECGKGDIRPIPQLSLQL